MMNSNKFGTEIKVFNFKLKLAHQSSVQGLLTDELLFAK